MVRVSQRQGLSLRAVWRPLGAIVLLSGVVGLHAGDSAQLRAPTDGPSMALPAWPPSEHVLLYLSFDEGQGEVARSPGLWGDAVLGSALEDEQTDPQWATGHRGGALRFDGQDDFLTVAGPGQVRLEELTIEAWVKPQGTSREIILDYGGYSWGFAFAKAWSGTYLGIGHKPRGTRVDTRQFCVTIGHWNHVAATLIKGVVRLYVNGRLEQEQAVAEAMQPRPGERPLIIGKVRSGHYFLTGYLDELLVLDVARSADEIFADMVASMQRAEGP